MSDLTKSFIRKYIDVVNQKNSILCVSLDPAIPAQRSKFTIPTDDRMEFMRKIIQDVAPFTSVIKMNRQYLIGLTADEIRSLNILIHQNGMLSIIDHKLSDLDTSNESAIFWFKEEGFDAFTFSPFGVNIEQASLLAHQKNLGIIVLTLLSNPEGIFYKIAQIDEKPLYLYIGERCRKARVDGFWLGNADHIEPKDVRQLKEEMGDSILALVPLYSSQYSVVRSAVYHFNSHAMISVGGKIVYSENPRQKAEEFRTMLNGFRTDMEKKRNDVLMTFKNS